MYKTYRKLRFINHVTPARIKLGLLVVAGIILPAVASITLRVISLGSRVEMYF